MRWHRCVVLKTALETRPAEIVQAELYEVIPIVLATQHTGITNEIQFIARRIVLVTRLIGTITEIEYAVQ